jgi:hypothetical protein
MEMPRGRLMRINLALIAASLLGLVAAGQAHAQAPVSQADVAAFEGTWTLDVARTDPGGEAERRVITTDGTAMRIEIHRAEDAYPITLVYKFDGSPTTNAFGSGTAVSKLVREGDGLLLYTVFTVRDQPITVHEMLPSRPDGATLVVDVMLRVEHGYQGTAPAGGRTPPNVAKAKRFYQKQP